MLTAKQFGIAAALLVSGVLATQAVQAQVPYPTKASQYKVSLVRAVDECLGPFVTVVNPGGVQGCVQANAITDAAVTGAIKATLRLTRSSKDVTVKLTGSGFTPAAQRIAAQLSLRTSNTLGTPSGSKTYEDQTLTCGTVAGGTCGNYFPSDPEGKINGKVTLAQCLTDNGLSTALATGNIELLDVRLINCDTGKAVAAPGVLK